MVKKALLLLLVCSHGAYTWAMQKSEQDYSPLTHREQDYSALTNDAAIEAMAYHAQTIHQLTTKGKIALELLAPQQAPKTLAFLIAIYYSNQNRAVQPTSGTQLARVDSQPTQKNYELLFDLPGQIPATSLKLLYTLHGTYIPLQQISQSYRAQLPEPCMIPLSLKHLSYHQRTQLQVNLTTALKQFNATLNELDEYSNDDSRDPDCFACIKFMQRLNGPTPEEQIRAKKQKIISELIPLYTTLAKLPQLTLHQLKPSAAYQDVNIKTVSSKWL